MARTCSRVGARTNGVVTSGPQVGGGAFWAFCLKNIAKGTSMQIHENSLVILFFTVQAMRVDTCPRSMGPN